MRYSFTLLMLTFLLLLGPSCELAKLSDPIVVSDIAPEFRIMPWEKLSPDDRSFQLHINTIQVTSCLNTQIDFRLSQANNRIDVSLRDIVDPLDCTPGEKPAQAVIDLGRLPSGFYELNIDLKNEIFNRGQLAVYGDRYAITMRSRNGFNLSPSELRKVPEQTIWGYVAFQQEADAGIARQFIGDLQSKSLAGVFPTGQYGYFQITDSGQVAVKEAPATTRIQQFIYSYPGQREDLQALVAAYRQNYPGQVTIRLFNSLGEEF